MNIKREIIRYMGILFAVCLMAMGNSWFLLPYNISPGGVTGISQIIHYFTGLPFGLLMLSINIPLFIAGFFIIGKSFGGKSIWGMTALSFATDFFNLSVLNKIGLVKNIDKYTFVNDAGRTVAALLPPEDIYLSAIAGSVLLGMGLGLVFRFRGSTGGTDIPVAIMKQKSGISIGTGFWIVETAIILSVGIILQDLRLIIWGYVNLYISTKITDLSSEGLPYIKGIFIMSEKPDEIRNQIFSQINRGVTFLKGESGYNRRDINVIFTVVNRNQVPLLTDIVKEIDPSSFMILTDVSDVMGYGFKSRVINLSE